MQTLPSAAMLAGGKMIFVVASHLGRQPGDIIAPAGQNLPTMGSTHWLIETAYLHLKFQVLPGRDLLVQINSEPIGCMGSAARQHDAVM